MHQYRSHNRAVSIEVVFLIRLNAVACESFRTEEPELFESSNVKILSSKGKYTNYFVRNVGKSLTA